jgi:hypothetical protein
VMRFIVEHSLSLPPPYISQMLDPPRAQM